MSPLRLGLLFIAALAAGSTRAAPSRAEQADVCADGSRVVGAIGDAGCSVLLVSANQVLTAAHCIDPRRHLLQKVSFGTGVARRSFAVTRCEAHPRFDGVNADFDLALCWLKESPGDVAAVDLTPTAASASAGESACVIGFHGDAASRRVRSSPAQVRQQLTAATARLAFESCAGDSGALVFLRRAGMLVPFGVVSGGEASRTDCSRVTLVARFGPALRWLADAR